MSVMTLIYYIAGNLQVDFLIGNTNIINMQYLTPSDLRKLAPATQKMPQSDEKLIDTKAFLRHLERQGFWPVFGAQGTAHTDADEPLKSRHLAVAVDKTGFAVAILNSHSIWRRAWLGAGFAVAGHFVLGAVVPLPRWKGYADPLEALLAYKDTLKEAKAALEGWVLEDHQRRWLAKQFAATAYLKGHKQPASKGLVAYADGATNNAYGFLLLMLKAVREGGLAPEPVDSFRAGRKLKPIISPDALMQASNAAFTVGLAGLQKYKLGSYAFPTYANTK